MAKKTVLVSDISGQEVPEGKGATVRVTYKDQRKGVRKMDISDEEADRLFAKARRVARRGRRPKTSAGGAGA
jgi:hypothetical protein